MIVVEFILGSIITGLIGGAICLVAALIATLFKGKQ